MIAAVEPLDKLSLSTAGPQDRLDHTQLLEAS